MKIEILPDADAVARKAAEIIAAEARASVARVAVSSWPSAAVTPRGKCCVL